MGGYPSFDPIKTETEWEEFFYEAKDKKQMVRVVDRWDTVREGRLYRCGSDRINVVPLEPSGSHTEVYYFDIKSAEILGPEPEGLQEFPVDWNRKVRRRLECAQAIQRK